MKHLTGNLSQSERVELEQGMRSIDEATFSMWVDELVEVNKDVLFSRKDAVFDAIENKLNENASLKPLRSPRYQRFLRIAAIWLSVILSIAGLYIYKGYQTQHLAKVKSHQHLTDDLTLPENEAMVTLADGTQMHFGAATNDTIRHKGIEVARLADGTLRMKQENNANIFFNKNDRHRLAAPKGVSLRILLPDSSIVWLNSGSSISIWASYGRQKRMVELDGEAYFDIRHHKNKPFFVTAKNTMVKVLGTQFNLSAYQTDPAVQTTLIQGAVHVSASYNSIRLKPGQQAVIKNDASITLHKNISLSQVLAWKEGYFRFQNKPISELLQELAKWYPIEGVEMLAGIDDKFTGSIKRSKKLADLLRAIEQVSALKFVIKERRVIVMK